MRLDLERIRGRLAELEALKPGWLDGEGSSYDAASLQRLGEFLGRVVELASPEPRIFPNPDGSVQIEWSIKAGAPGHAEVSADFDLEQGTVWMHGLWMATDRDRDVTLVWSDDKGHQRVAAFVNSFT